MKIWLIFDIEKDIKNQNFASFDLQNARPRIFYANQVGAGAKLIHP